MNDEPIADHDWLMSVLAYMEKREVYIPRDHGAKWIKIVIVSRSVEATYSNGGFFHEISRTTLPLKLNRYPHGKTILEGDRLAALLSDYNKSI